MESEGAIEVQPPQTKPLVNFRDGEETANLATLGSVEMSYDVPNFQSILERFSRLRQASVGGGRAPHKPLLILLMIGRHQRGERGPAFFQSIREPLENLLRDFGPPSSGRPDVANPFWRLQNDEGRVWEVRDSSGGRIAETTTPPTIGMLVERESRGNFTGDLCDAFRE